MKEAEFVSELYRHLKNKLLGKFSKNGVEIKIEESPSLDKLKNPGRADIVIHDQKGEVRLIIEAKVNNKELPAAITQVYRYGLFFMRGVEDRYLAVCTPNKLKIYEYNFKLGIAAGKTPKENEGMIFIDADGNKSFSWEDESDKRLVKNYSFEDGSISKIVLRIINFLESSNTLNK